MTDILMTFRSDVPTERREQILDKVSAWPGVEVAAPIKRDAPAAFQRFSYARVASEQVEAVTNALNDIPEVEEAQVAPRRGL